MDTFDSRRSSVPARLPSGRPAASLAPRLGSSLPELAPSSPISLRVAFRGARRYWWLVLALWTVGSAGIGAFLYLKVRPTYRAISLLRVDPSATNLYDSRSSGESLDPFLQTQVQLITSPNVLTAAATNPKAAILQRIQTAGDPVIELRKVIQVAILPGTYLLEVSMSSPNAYEAATLINAVVDAFIDANSEWSDGMTRTQIKNLETYLAELKNQTEELERRWKEVVAKSEGGQVIQVKQPAKPGAVVDQGSPVSISLGHYQQITQNLFDLGIELATAEAALDAARRAHDNAARNPPAALERTLTNQEINRKIQNDPGYVNLLGDLDRATKKFDEAVRVTRHPSDPARIAAQKTIDTVRGKLSRAYKAKADEIQHERDGGGGAVDSEKDIRQAEAHVQELLTKQKALKEQHAQLKVTNQRLGIEDVDIYLIKENRESLKTMQDTVYRRLEQLRFEAKGEDRIRPVNPAVPPSRPISDKRMQYLAIAPIGVLGVVLGLVVLLEIRSGRVADPEHLSSRVRHEVFSIAPLPNIRPGDEVNDEKAEQRLARFVQSLDHLRVALCEGGIPGEGRCVMITSATGGEGKTTLSAHLAARCANSGTSTLLIDADMRRASLGRLLDVPVGPGLLDVLGDEADLESALITVQAGGFHFLSAGTPGRDPSRVLKSARLAELIGRLRQAYDLIIIDTPPVLPVADALILGRWADGAVVAARFDSSRLPLVERANRQLAMAGIPVLGVVINGVRGQDAAYGNYAYSYNYQSQPEGPEASPKA